MLASGTARARSTTSASCGWNTQASSDRPSAVSRRRPARKSDCLHECGPCAVWLLPMIVARVPRRRVAHAAESPAAGPDVRLQHRLDAVAQGEIGEAHDAGGDARRPVEAALAHRRHAGHELGLAHRPHLLGPARAVHRVAFDEHRGDDVVAGADVGEELVQQVAVVRAVPQVMMGVDDRQVGLEDRLGRLLGQPRLVGRVDPAEPGRPSWTRAPGSPSARSGAAPAASAWRSGRARGSTSSAFAAGRLKTSRATPASR